MKRCLRCDERFETDAWSCPACGWAPQWSGNVPLFAPALDSVREGFDPRYFENLWGLESGSFWFRSRNRLILWAIERFFGKAGSMLEIGCGTGFVLAAIEAAQPRLTLHGSEVHTAGLGFTARRLQRARLLQMDARNIPYDGEFDLIGAFDVLEHIEEDESVLREASRALKPGGGLLLTVPQHRFLWSAADDYTYHKRRYTRGELVSKVERAGFSVVLCTSFVSLLMPFLIGSRLTRRSTADFDPEAEFRIPAFVNVLFERAMGVEHALIKAGLRLPFGGSLLLAATRQERERR
jgi:SAM-dependent methyltransferase